MPLLIPQADADSFYTACNGHPFNSIEDAVCQLIYVERAEVIKSEEVPVIPSGVATAGRRAKSFGRMLKLNSVKERRKTFFNARILC